MASKRVFTFALVLIACATSSAACQKRTAVTRACDPFAVTRCPLAMESAPVVAEGAPARVADGKADVTSRAVLGPFVLTCNYPFYPAANGADPAVGLETCKLTEPPCTDHILLGPHVPARAVALRKTDQGVLGITLQQLGTTKGVPLVCFERLSQAKPSTGGEP